MATVKPIAIVSPMKKTRKSKKKKNNKVTPKKSTKFDNNLLRPPSTISVTNSSSDHSQNAHFFNRIAFERPDRLCAMFEGMSLGVPQADGSSQREVCIPEHDKKILERMSAKLRRELNNIELSHQAHLIWDNERKEREKLQQEQNKEYRKYLREKRKAEKDLLEQKFSEVAQIYDWEKEHLRSRICMKEDAAAKRLRALEYFKNNELLRKHEMAQEKSTSALVTMRERKLEEVAWRKTLAENLEQRTSNALVNKEILLRLNKERTAIDNRIHLEIQRRNRRDQQLHEMQKLGQLQQQLLEKRRRMQLMQRTREDLVRRARRLADCTARMRDNIKRCLSPDVFMRSASQLQHRSMTPQLMCFTPNSFQSHIRLG